MDSVTEAKEKLEEKLPKKGGNGDGKGSLAKRVLVPLAASAASAAAAYAARKVPGLVQEKVLPKLKEAAGSGTAGDAVSKAKDAVGGTVSGAVSTVSERVGGGGDGQQAAPSKPARSIPTKEREQARRQRAERRQERKQALK